VIRVKSIVGQERPLPDGFERVQPPEDSPLAIAPGDRLWVRVAVDPELHVYGLSQPLGDSSLAFVSPPLGAQAEDHEHRFPFPQGWVLSEAAAQMRTLLVVASLAAIDALEALTPGQIVPEEQVNPLQLLAPRRLRGQRDLPLPEMIHVPGVVLVFGNIAEHTRAEQVAVETHFVHRQA